MANILVAEDDADRNGKDKGGGAHGSRVGAENRGRVIYGNKHL